MHLNIVGVTVNVPSSGKVIPLASAYKAIPEITAEALDAVKIPEPSLLSARFGSDGDRPVILVTLSLPGRKLQTNTTCLEMLTVYSSTDVLQNATAALGAGADCQVNGTTVIVYLGTSATIKSGMKINLKGGISLVGANAVIFVAGTTQVIKSPTIASAHFTAVSSIGANSTGNSSQQVVVSFNSAGQLPSSNLSCTDYITLMDSQDVPMNVTEVVSNCLLNGSSLILSMSTPLVYGK